VGQRFAPFRRKPQFPSWISSSRANASAGQATSRPIWRGWARAWKRSALSATTSPGTSLRKCLQDAGIVDKGVLADPRRVTTVKTRIIARHQQVVRVDREHREPLRPETEERILRALFAALKHLDAWLSPTTTKAWSPTISPNAFLARAISCAWPFFVKPKTSRLYAYRGARAIVCNAKEAGSS